MATIGLKKFTLKLSKSFVSNAAKEIIHDADEEEKKEKYSHHFHQHSSNEKNLLIVPKTLTNSKSFPALKNVLSEISLNGLDSFTTKNSTTVSLSSLNNFEETNNKHEKPIFHFDNEFEISSTEEEHGTHLFR